MLTSYQLSLSVPAGSHSRPEWGYRLYSSLLERVPGQYGADVHQDGVTPLSQFLALRGDSLLWTISLFGEESESAVGPLLESARDFFLEKDHVRLTVTDRSRTSIRGVEELLSLGAAHAPQFRMTFHTATAFKSQGQYVSLPTTRLILQSLIKKWNGCFPECPIEDEDNEGLEALAAGLRVRDFKLFSRIYYLKGNSIPGFIGDLTLENRLQGFHRDITGTLLLFASFSGVGIKTTLGMGGVTLS